MATEQTNTSLQELAGKYLTFAIQHETYGLRILKVQEIIGMQSVTRVPKTPVYVRGVINLRGKVIPVVDLRLKFGLPAKEDTERTCIIVVKVEMAGRSTTMGVIVDEVTEVADIPADRLESTPTFGVSVDTASILAMAKIGKSVVTLLDIDGILSSGELAIPQTEGALAAASDGASDDASAAAS